MPGDHRPGPVLRPSADRTARGHGSPALRWARSHRWLASTASQRCGPKISRTAATRSMSRSRSGLPTLIPHPILDPSRSPIMNLDGVLFFPVTPYAASDGVDAGLMKEHVASRIYDRPGGE